MSLIVVEQMIIIFLLILVGAIIYKLGHLTKESTRDLSWIVVNVTNPITMLVAAIEDNEKISNFELGIAFMALVLVYIILGIFAYLLPIILRIEKSERYSYNFMGVFANVGFIGIPFCSAVLGVHSLIYVTLCIFVFNIIAYSVGMSVMRKIGKVQNPDVDFGSSKISIFDIINTGTVMSVLTILIYVSNIRLPLIMESTLSYIGRCTTFISMVVLGVSVAQVSLKEIFSGGKIYIFIVIRQILIPIVLLYILRMFLTNDLMVKTIIILSAMPCANMPLMMAKQFKVNDTTLSKGIILTTLLSVITIPIVSLML